VRDEDRRPPPAPRRQRSEDIGFGLRVDGTRIAGFFNNALAIASRCRWPPESVTPRSPTIVS
jgi:hypothetical protein